MIAEILEGSQVMLCGVEEEEGEEEKGEGGSRTEVMAKAINFLEEVKVELYAYQVCISL